MPQDILQSVASQLRKATIDQKDQVAMTVANRVATEAAQILPTLLSARTELWKTVWALFPAWEAETKALADQIAQLKAAELTAEVQAKIDALQQQLDTANAARPPSPADLVAAWDDRAASLFKWDAELCAFAGTMLSSLGFADADIADILPGVPSSYTATLNADGTVTLTAK